MGCSAEGTREGRGKEKRSSILKDTEEMPLPHRVVIRQTFPPNLSLRSQELHIFEALLCVAGLLFL